MEYTICEIISSVRDELMINVHGYIMIKDKSRGDLYYWYCDKRDTLNCDGRANTILINGKHILRKARDHNHAAE